MSQPFPLFLPFPTSDIFICYSHLNQFGPLHDRHSPFWPFSNTRTSWGAENFSPILKKSASSCIFVWVLPILSSFNTFCSFCPFLALAASFIPVALTAFRYSRPRHSSSPRHIVCSYRVRPCHGTYSPRSRSSVLVTHALANGVVRSTRHGVVHSRLYVLATESFITRTRHGVVYSRRIRPRIVRIIVRPHIVLSPLRRSIVRILSFLSASSSLRCLRSHLFPCTFSTLCPSLRQSLMFSLTLRMEANNLPRWSPAKLLSSCSQ